jgi:SOS-response transcriptional repressor LexA
MTKKLTEKQVKVLNYLIEYSEAKGFMPTNAEISRFMDSDSSNTSRVYLDALQSKRILTSEKGVSRGITLHREVANYYLEQAREIQPRAERAIPRCDKEPALAKPAAKEVPMWARRHGKATGAVWMLHYLQQCTQGA